MNPMHTVQDLEAIEPMDGRDIRWVADRVQLLRAALIQLAVERPDADADAAVTWLTVERMDSRIVVTVLALLGKTFTQEWDAARGFVALHAPALGHLLPESF
jgi:hypothetical protein